MSSALADTIDLAAFEGWLQDRLGGHANVTDTTRLTGGTQNLMLSFRYGTRALVLRRAPATHARGLAREACALAALATTTVPHPPPVATCDDVSVIRAPFLVVE